jgi:hypothetical protein
MVDAESETSGSSSRGFVVVVAVLCSGFQEFWFCAQTSGCSTLPASRSAKNKTALPLRSFFVDWMIIMGGPVWEAEECFESGRES